MSVRRSSSWSIVSVIIAPTSKIEPIMIEGTPIKYARVGDIPDMMTELWSAPRSSRLAQKHQPRCDDGQSAAHGEQHAERFAGTQVARFSSCSPGD
jgi:hypothetical protein